jgi:quercetin dioxygenase-like cupin family protein
MKQVTIGRKTMKRTLLLLVAGLAGMAAGAIGVTYVSAQGAVPQITRTEILRQPLSGLEGKEVVVFTADVPAGGVAPRHYHPGDETIYMLQGSLLFEPDHSQPFELKAGEVTFNPAKHIHQAKNTGSQPAKVLNFMIAEKGQPLAIPVN